MIVEQPDGSVVVFDCSALSDSCVFVFPPGSCEREWPYRLP